MSINRSMKAVLEGNERYIDKGSTLKICKAKAMMVLVTLLLTNNANALTDSGGGSWIYYKDILITNVGIDLTDYQILVNLNNSNFPMNADSNGADIRFTDVTGAELSYWIESWNYTGKSAMIWVKVPSISASTITTIRMYYGNQDASPMSSAVGTFIRDIGGVVGSWHFDEGSGTTAYDTSGNRNIGTLTNGPTWIDGIHGKALRFDGIDDYVKINKDDSWQVQNLTIELWIKPDIQLHSYAGIIGSHSEGNPYKRGWVIQQDGRITNKFYFAYGDGANWQGVYRSDYPDLTVDLATNVWQHLVVTKLNNYLKIYLNGTLVNTFTTINAAIFYGTGSTRPDLYIGDWFVHDRQLNGTIDEVRIYNKELNSEEILDLYNNYGYTTTNNPGNVLVRKYTPFEPSLTIGAENPVLATITVSPSPVLIKVGNTQTFTATPEGQSGNPIPATVTWSSSNTSVGTIDPNTGVFTAKAAGTTTVDATSGNVMGSASVVVTPAETSVAPYGFRFVQLTDIHIGPDIMSCAVGGLKSCITSYAESIIRFINVREDISKSVKPNFVLITGDSVEWNTANQYPVFNKLISKFNDVNIDVYIVPGNHDRRGQDFPVPNTFFPSNDLANYEKYIVDDTKYDMSDRYFDQETYRFIGLDSGSDPELAEPIIEGDLRKLYNFIMYPNGSGLSKEQIDFTNDISTNRTIIFMHHPVVDNECKNSSCNIINDNRDLLIELAKNKHAKLVLTGHTHESKFLNYEGDKIPVFGRDIVRPLFIQTRSATKEFPLGYLIINTDEMGEHIKEKLITESGMDYKIAFLESPADQHVYDESGGHTGINDTGGIDNNIPDSYYFEELKIGNITIPAFVLLQNASLNYSFKIVSNFSKGNVIAPQSSINFTIEHKTKNATITVKYSSMSITRESRAYLQINTTQTNYTMQIDLDNDGIIDATKQPDTVITDYAPAAIILSPSDSSVWDQGQSITFSGAGADREDGTLTGLTWISDIDGIIGHANFTTSNLSAGIHNITLLVNDTSGQINTSKMILIVRDTIPPVIKIEYPSENKIFNKQNVSVNGIAYDDSGILNVRVNGIQAGKENWNTILELNGGENKIEVVATDNNGFSTATYRTIYYNSSLASDTTPPAAITNLTHKTGYDNMTHGWINWTWDNPKDEDFSYVSIYLDNILMENTSRSYFSISGLSRDADYNISILSADIVDNINYTDIKDTLLTTPPDALPDTQPTTVITLPGTPGSDGPGGSPIPSPVPSPITDPPTQIPEFPTIALPIISAIGIMLLIARRK